jgi:hypothetical protein
VQKSLPTKQRKVQEQQEQEQEQQEEAIKSSILFRITSAPQNYIIFLINNKMATWFTVVGRVAQIDGIADSLYKNALIGFEEGDSNSSLCRSFYVAFWGELLLSGRIYVIFGTGRLTGNGSCTQPKVRALSCCIFIIDINVRIRISSLRTMLSLWP